MEKIYSKIESISGNVITVKAENVAYGELAEISTSFGKSLAEVIKLDRDLVSLQVFAGGRGISTGDRRFRAVFGKSDACFLFSRFVGEGIYRLRRAA